MKSFLRNIVINSFSLFLLTQVLSGVEINGGLTTYAITGIALSLLMLVIKPILNVIALPFNLVTFGLFSALTNSIILYLLTISVPNVSIRSFNFTGFSYAGFVIPQFYLNTIFAFIAASLTLSLMIGFINWIRE